MNWLRSFYIQVLVISLVGSATAEPLEIYIDADYSKNRSASYSIESGVRAALETVGYRIGGQDVVVIRKDHRSNVKRSRRHMEQFIASETALVMYGGLNSPPYLANRDFMNENGVFTLLTWSAAGPITRAQPGHENWIFRLSVDDTKAAPFLVSKAIADGACERVALVLLDTGWGHANRGPLTTNLSEHGRAPVAVEFFPGSVSAGTALSIAEQIAQGDPDCAIMIADWQGGSEMVKAMHARLPDIRLFSHWGIMGGSFHNTISDEIRSAHQLSVLQTCGLRREREGNPVLTSALANASNAPTSLTEIPAPTGFVHGYDMTLLLIEAGQQAANTPEWRSSITAKRRALKAALEHLDSQVDGILKTYTAPFTTYDPQHTDAHEALNGSDLCLAQFAREGHLVDMH